MKVVLRILIYLFATIANFALYVLLFMSAAGLSPKQSMDILKDKVEEVAVDTTSAEAGQQLSDAMKSEIQKALENGEFKVLPWTAGVALALNYLRNHNR